MMQKLFLNDPPTRRLNRASKVVDEGRRGVRRPFSFRESDIGALQQ